MKTKILKLVSCLALLGAVVTAPAQSVFTITGTGSGSLNGVAFTDSAFEWTLTFSTDNPNISFGANNPIYTLSVSQITLNGGSPINVTEEEGLWINLDPSLYNFSAAPIRMSGGSATGNILTVYGTPGWDGVTAFTSDADPGSAFNQFWNIATDQGPLTMSDGTVSLVTITGAPVPEPSTLALASLGSLSLLLFRRKQYISV
ncbi:MAG: PEP-CTERM sorting domain-containing protein [Verrucomicrobiota bacterium]|jgi:hypothetical protein